MLIRLIVFTDKYLGHNWTFYTNGSSLHFNYIQIHNNKDYKRVFCNNTKSLANKTTNFINESHLLIWGKLQLGLTRQTAREPSIYVTDSPYET